MPGIPLAIARPDVRRHADRGDEEEAPRSCSRAVTRSCRPRPTSASPPPNEAEEAATGGQRESFGDIVTARARRHDGVNGW